MKKRLSLLMAAVILMTSNTAVYAADVSASAVEGTELPANTKEAENTQNSKNEETSDGAAAPESQNGSKEAETPENGGKGPESTEASEGSHDSEESGSLEDSKTPEDTNKPEDNQDSEGTETDDSSKNTEKDKHVEGSVQVENGEDEKTSEVKGNVIVDENNDNVEIKKNDKPYLSLGADLSDEQRGMVLSLMGINEADLANYDVVYVTNAEEHKYLDAYIESSKIGSRSLSSVVIVKRKKGNGLNISTNNITYCTVGMYKNALTTAGVTDADIIVAGPTGISGTAALVGILKAYQEMTGEEISSSVVDAALHELVLTGELEDSLEGLTDQEVEEFIAYIKSVIAKNDLSDEASINKAIDEACEKYGVTLSAEERQQIVDFLLKLTSLGIDLNGLVDYASSLYNSFKNGEGTGGIFSSIGDFFSNIFSSIGDFFKNLFS